MFLMSVGSDTIQIMLALMPFLNMWQLNQPADTSAA
jgi:hypothetical protein